MVLNGNVELLRGLTIAIIGYGNQGRAQATIMRDSGLKVIVGNVRDEYWETAKRDGFEVYEIGEAARRADVIMMLLPDEVQPYVFKEQVAPAVKDRRVIIDFASGYNVAFGLIEPPREADVVLVAPRMIGAAMLELHRRGRGFPVFLGVANDASGRAWDYAAALGAAIGALGKPGGIGIKVTFKQEALVDLLDEHTNWPLLLASLMAFYDVTVHKYGVPPEAVLLEMYASGEMAEVASRMAEMGVFDQLRLHSTTSQYGQLSRALKYYDYVRRVVEEEAREIWEGDFAREWGLEQLAGRPKFRALWDIVTSGEMHQAEKRLFELMGMTLDNK